MKKTIYNRLTLAFGRAVGEFSKIMSAESYFIPGNSLRFEFTGACGQHTFRPRTPLQAGEFINRILKERDPLFQPRDEGIADATTRLTISISHYFPEKEIGYDVYPRPLSDHELRMLTMGLPLPDDNVREIAKLDYVFNDFGIEEAKLAFQPHADDIYPAPDLHILQKSLMAAQTAWQAVQFMPQPF